VTLAAEIGPDLQLLAPEGRCRSVACSVFLGCDPCVLSRFFHGPIRAGRADWAARKLIGIPETDGVSPSFRGIAYAQPPVGPLRWKPPRPLAPAPGPIDATRFAPACAQGDGPALAGGPAAWPRRWGPNPPRPADTAQISEDCLYLNIWTPESIIFSRAEAVAQAMVWIDGRLERRTATRMSRTTWEPFWQGKALSSFSINYRLGLLGFLAHPGATWSRARAAGQGLLDELAAVRWIKARDRAHFGGDPSQIALAFWGSGPGGTDIGYCRRDAAGEEL